MSRVSWFPQYELPASRRRNASTRPVTARASALRLFTFFVLFGFALVLVGHLAAETDTTRASPATSTNTVAAPLSHVETSGTVENIAGIGGFSATVAGCAALAICAALGIALTRKLNGNTSSPLAAHTMSRRPRHSVTVTIIGPPPRRPSLIALSISRT